MWSLANLKQKARIVKYFSSKQESAVMCDIRRMHYFGILDKAPSQFGGLFCQYLLQPLSYLLVHTVLCWSPPILLHKDMYEASNGFDSVLPLLKYPNLVQYTGFAQLK